MMLKKEYYKRISEISIFITLVSVIILITQLSSALVINGDVSYNSTNINITNERGFTHLNISNNDPYNSLMIYLPFDVNSTNSSMYDYTNNKNNGVVFGNAQWNASGFYNGAFSFDGVNDFINITNEPGFDFINQSFSLLVWANQIQKNSARLVTKGNASALQYLLSADVGGDNMRCITVNSSGANTIVTDPNLLSNSTWVSFGCTFNASNNVLTLYRDGVNVSSGTMVGLMRNLSNSLTIGAEENGVSTNDYLGSLDDFMMFNTTLTPKQMLDIYNNQSNRYTTNGTQTFQNINLTGNNTIEINISNYQNFMGSTILGQFTSGTESGIASPFILSSNKGTISSYDLSGITNKSAVNLTLYFYPNGTLTPNSVANTTSIADTLSTNPILHLVDTSNDTTVSNCNLTTSFVASVGTVNVTVNKIGVGTITTTDTSPKTFSYSCINNIRGVNNITYSPTISATITIQSSNLSYNEYRDFYSPNAIGNITITDLTTGETTPPNFTGIPNNQSITYPSYWSGVVFNVTDASGISFYKVNDTRFTINQSGFLNASSLLGAGTYIMNITVNDTFNNIATAYYNLTILKGTLTGLISGNGTFEYPNQTTITGSESNSGDADVSYVLYRDNISVSNPDVQTLGVKNYIYIFNTTGGANYSSVLSLDLRVLTITQNSTYNISISGTTPITYGTPGNFQGNGCPSGLSCTLYRNNVSVSNPDTSVLGVGSYTYNFNSTSNTNYTSNQSIQGILIVNQNSSAINLTLNHTRNNITISQGSSIYLNVSTLIGDSSARLLLYNNGTLINNGTSPISNLTTFSNAGAFNITAYYSQSQNYSLSSLIYYVNVNNIIYPTFSNFSVVPVNSSNYTFGQAYSFNSTILSTNGTSGIEFDGTNYSVSNSSSVFNVSLFLSAGVHTYYWWSFGNGSNQNYNLSQLQSYTINKAIPSGSIINQTALNMVYGSPFNFTILESNLGDADVAYQIYRNGANVTNQIGVNVVLDPGTYTYIFNTTGGTNYSSISSLGALSLTISGPASNSGGGSGGVSFYPNITVNQSQFNITITNQTKTSEPEIKGKKFYLWILPTLVGFFIFIFIFLYSQKGKRKTKKTDKTEIPVKKP